MLSPPTWPWRTCCLQPPWPSPPFSCAFECCWDHKVHFYLPVVDAPDPRGLVGQTIRTTCINKTTAHEHGDNDPIHHNLQKCTWSLSYCRSLTRPTSINCWTGSTFRHCWQLVLTRNWMSAEVLSNVFRTSQTPGKRSSFDKRISWSHNGRSKHSQLSRSRAIYYQSTTRTLD